MRGTHRIVSLIVVTSFAVTFTGLTSAAHASVPGDDGSHCVEYNGQVIYCIHYE